MYYIGQRKGNNIEIVLKGFLSKNAFVQVIYHLELMSNLYERVNVLFNAAEMHRYDFSLMLEEFDLYRRYHHRLRRVAIVSDDEFRGFFMRLFATFSEVEFSAFARAELPEAREWIFDNCNFTGG